MTHPLDLQRGDVVLVAFPFVREGQVERKRRPAVVVQADRYNRRRDAIIIAAITSTQAHKALPCKVLVRKESPDGRRAGLKLDSVVDCQTLATIPRSEIAARLGRFSTAAMALIDAGLRDAVGL
jgi:mRNA-degrading endonuclease toxin of MazEF toxin-antitoxin module